MAGAQPEALDAEENDGDCSTEYERFLFSEEPAFRIQSLVTLICKKVHFFLLLFS